MSIYIEGMEKPQNCHGCPLVDFLENCPCHKMPDRDFWDSGLLEFAVHEDCPIREVHDRGREYLPQVECQPYYQPKLPRNYRPDEDALQRRGKLFSDIEQLGIKHNPDGSMEVAFKPQEAEND